MNKIEFKKKPVKVQREKGKSLTYLPNEFVVVDTETTGLSPIHDDIIEIGAIKIKDWEIVDSFNFLVKPRPFYYFDNNGNEIISYVDDFITNLTGINNEMLEHADNIEDVIPKFIDFIGDSILAGHHFHFDLNFLYDSSLKVLNHKLQNNFIDSLRFSRRVLPELPNHKLKTICKHFNIDTKGSHRALIDSENTFKCLKNINEYILSNNINIDDLFKSSHGSQYFNLSIISSEEKEFDKEHELYNKTCVFTGKLEYLIRKEAAQLVANFGGITNNGVTKETDILVIGSFDRVSNLKGNKSSKQQKAEQLILNGQDIQIMDEDTFYGLIDFKIL